MNNTILYLPKFLQNNMSFETAQFCKKLMDREHFNEAHIYYLKTAEVLFDQLICDIFEG